MNMSKLLVKDREIVVPGQVLMEGMDYLPGNGTYRQNEKIRANRLGLLQIDGKILKTIPLSGRYLPKRNDVIIGRVIDILISGWRLDLDCPYSAMLSTKEASFDFIAKWADLSKILALDDYVVTKIINVTSQNLVDVTLKGSGFKKLKGGRIIKVNTYKVPRIIGKKGSMISMVKNATDCKIIVGQNGLVWIQGEPSMEVVAADAIKKIEDESYLSGLTERIKDFLEKKTGKKVEIPIVDDTPEQHRSAPPPRRTTRQPRQMRPPRQQRQSRPPRRSPAGGFRKRTKR
jgi:exosome complex component RRP4